MLTQLLAAVATLLGWAGTWTVGSGRRAGWLAGAAACGLWVAVNTALGLAAGIASAAVGVALAIRNWRTDGRRTQAAQDRRAALPGEGR